MIEKEEFTELVTGNVWTELQAKGYTMVHTPSGKYFPDWLISEERTTELLEDTTGSPTAPVVQLAPEVPDMERRTDELLNMLYIEENYGSLRHHSWINANIWESDKSSLVNSSLVEGMLGE